MGDLIRDKSYAFALRIVRLSDYLNKERREFVLSRKILDSGTNIGLFIEEGRQGENRPDFIQKYSIANKEAFKTNFLLRLLRDSEQITPEPGGIFGSRLRGTAETSDNVPKDSTKTRISYHFSLISYHLFRSLAET